MNSKKRGKPKKLKIFFDFDNTITTFDTIDDMIVRFSINDKWKKLEYDWTNGKIGSRKCLDGQIRNIRITRAELSRYLRQVRIDPYFKKILSLLRANGVAVFILSDNFDYILKRVLKNNGIRRIPVYCNGLSFQGDRLIPHFRFTDKFCTICAHCKKNNLLANAGKGYFTAYVGDGISDVCPSKNTDLIFAKASLLRRLKDSNVEHVAYDTLKDVYDYIKEKLI